MTDVSKTVEDWAARAAENGISGSVTTVSDVNGDRNIRELDDTKIPSELIQHLREILRERDRMVEAALKVSIEIPNHELNMHHLASLKNSCLLMAIDVIRKKYTGEDHGTTADSDQRSTEAAGPSTESAS